MHILKSRIDDIISFMLPAHKKWNKCECMMCDEKGVLACMLPRFSGYVPHGKTFGTKT